MEIVLFVVVVGVWAVFVLPVFVSRRRMPAVNRSYAGDPGDVVSPDVRRRQVLARRKLALVALAVTALGTLVGAVLTGSFVLLAITLVCDVLLAVYIAFLLQIKRRQAELRYLGGRGGAGAATF